MKRLNIDIIKKEISHTDVIFKRGEHLFFLGNYTLVDGTPEEGSYSYSFDGNYGEYHVAVSLAGDGVKGTCSCPYPHGGCKHIVAACLDIKQRLDREQTSGDRETVPEEYLTPEEIKEIALEGRKERAKKEKFILDRGEMYKGTHIVKSPKGSEYTVTIYSPADRSGHCTCPDFARNHLDTCKHLLFVYDQFEKESGFPGIAGKELFPFVHIIYSSRQEKPFCYHEKINDPELLKAIGSLFNEKGMYTRKSLDRLYALFSTYGENELIRFDDFLLSRMEDILYRKEVAKIQRKYKQDFSFLKGDLYPYQEEGVLFAVFKKSAIIADEMGLGKTLQAIAVAVIKKQIFGFSKVLVVTPASVKEQWKKEIGKFTGEQAVVVSGSRKNRQQLYSTGEQLFKITNYEAVLRDSSTISEWCPDLIILDEAQRIKNFETKTHQAVLKIPHNHSLVITGTPLENKLEDIYSIVQFSDPGLFSPLWAFAANHFNVSRKKKNSVLGYRNLDVVREKLKSLVIRRRREDVFESLPDQIVNNYYLDLSPKQLDIHQGYAQSLLRIINKKVLTPMDIKRIQMILLKMRMVCNSTYLIDKKSNISPKLVELVSVLKELVLSNKRKVLIFSEWTTMTYLVGKVLSELGIDFIEYSGKIPPAKRQVLVQEFHDNPDCMVFLSTDAGGVGLNLQNADCLINIELPWNPAKLNQRIGRINRIGQKSSKIHIVNMICKNSIEEKVLAGINLKQELFDALFEGGAEEVDFSRENKNKFINQIRAMFEEEVVEARGEKQEGPELDEKTPHYLNPEVFKEKEMEIDIAAEESPEVFSDGQDEKGQEKNEVKTKELESVLNQGFSFLNALSQMATGKPLVEGEGGKAIEIDRQTGEVIMRFKLPGI